MSTLDLTFDYHQIPINESVIQKMAFMWPSSTIKATSFGLSRASSTFQKLMNTVLTPVIRKCALEYLDEIINAPGTFAGYIEHLKVVFMMLKQEELTRSS